MPTIGAPAQAMPALQGGTDQHYLSQLTRGFSRLRFDAPLEAEYRATLEGEQRNAALMCALMTLVLWLGFAISDLFRTGLIANGTVAPDLWALLAARWGLLVLVSAFFLTPLQRTIPLHHSAFTIYTLIGLVAAANAVIYRSHGLQAADNALVVVVMAAFMPMGLTFMRAVSAALLVVGFTAIAGLAWLERSLLPAHLTLTFVMAIAAAVSMTGGYLREHAHRRQFLLTAVLSRQAQFDPLTDLANRRLFQRHAELVIAHAARHDEPLVLAILDIDHFKTFNDRYGHAVGDEALRAVAEVLQGAARRPMDLAARVGGEEFALLLFGCDIGRAAQVLEAVRQRVTTISLARPDSVSLSISIGATAPQSGETLATTYERADRLLYASKTSGRDRVSMA